MRLGEFTGRHLGAWLLFCGAAPLILALLSQYVGGLHPCHFCLLQRYPYGVIVLAAIGFFASQHRLWRGCCAAISVLSLWATAMLAAIHSGIETGYFKESGGCVSDLSAGQSLDAIRAQILGAPLVACNDVSATFLGFSMANWNVVCALAMSILTVFFYRRWYHRGADCV